MGEHADAILEGDDCELCGCYIGGGQGFPRKCEDCEIEVKPKRGKK